MSTCALHTTMLNRIVLDTNCLLASLSSSSPYFIVWRGLQEGKYILCVSNDILNEYQEIIERKTNAQIAANVINTLLESRFVKCFDPHFRFNLIKRDPDDNKFVDCAICAQAQYVVSNDNHFKDLVNVDFPKVWLINLQQFARMLAG